MTTDDYEPARPLPRPVDRDELLRAIRALGEPPHGTRRRYLRGCGCEECRAANTRYQRLWKRGARARGQNR